MPVVRGKNIEVLFSASAIARRNLELAKEIAAHDYHDLLVISVLKGSFIFAADLIRAMHDADLGPIRQLLFEFLSGWLGGPALYFERAEHRCIMSAHRPYAIGDAERDEWMTCMRRAMFDCDITGDMYDLLDRAFLRMANAFRTRPAG